MLLKRQWTVVRTCLEVAPATLDTLAMLLNEVLHRHTQLLLHCAGVIHVATDVEQLRALIVVSPERREPIPYVSIRQHTSAYVQQLRALVVVSPER